MTTVESGIGQSRAALLACFIHPPFKYREIQMQTCTNASFISTAVAAAFIAGQAMATVPAVAPNAVVYAGGASSEAGAIVAGACRLLTNVDSYTDAASGANSSSYRVLYGDLKTATGGLAAGAHVLVV